MSSASIRTMWSLIPSVVRLRRRHRLTWAVSITPSSPSNCLTASWMARWRQPCSTRSLARFCFFDPTDEMTPFGQLHGALQANYGLLVTPDRGELIVLPQLTPTMNGIQWTAKLSLNAKGKARCDVQETRVSHRARSERLALRNAPQYP